MFCFILFILFNFSNFYHIFIFIFYLSKFFIDSLSLLQTEVTRIVSRCEIFIESAIQDLKTMVSMEQALYLTQVLRVIKQVIISVGGKSGV